MRPLTLDNNDLTAREDWLMGQKKSEGMNVKRFDLMAVICLSVAVRYLADEHNMKKKRHLKTFNMCIFGYTFCFLKEM